MCAVWLAGVAVASADTTTNLRLIVDAVGVLPPAIRANLISEASRIWSREHVSLVTEDNGHCQATDPETVVVRIEVGNDTQSGDAGLGAIRFSPAGTPESVIVLNLDSVVRIATSAPVMGVHPALWPAGLREEIIARALGRALAHEIGHYLLRSPHHTSSGLMQARYKGSAIGNPNNRQFVLTSPDRARLRIALAAPLDHEPVCPILATR